MGGPHRIYRHHKATDAAWFFVGALALGCALFVPDLWRRLEEGGATLPFRPLVAGVGLLCILAALANLPAKIVLDDEGLRFVGAFGRVGLNVPWQDVEGWYVRSVLKAFPVGESGATLGPVTRRVRNVVFLRAGGGRTTLLETDVAFPLLGRPERFTDFIDSIRGHLAARERPAPDEDPPPPGR